MEGVTETINLSVAKGSSRDACASTNVIMLMVTIIIDKGPFQRCLRIYKCHHRYGYHHHQAQSVSEQELLQLH